MTNTIATFENTVGILVKAFLEGTLLKGTCSACAVGNICAAAAGAKVIEARRLDTFYTTAKWSNGWQLWSRVFETGNMDGEILPQTILPGNYRGAAKEQIDATGYTWQQLARVENAFETAQAGYSEAAEFAGLMAVVDVLADIHSIDLTTATAAKALFVRA